MFESYFFEAEKKNSLITIFILTFIITITLGMVNYFIGADFLFLVTLVSVALTYPVVSYIRDMNTEEIRKEFSTKKLLLRHDRELFVFWTIFIAITFVFVILVNLGIVNNFTYQESFITNINGNAVNPGIGFDKIIVNNLTVALLTFIICFVSFSGLIFVLTWNSSILAYHIYKVGNIGFFNLPHGLLEIGGYVFAGICGTFMAYGVSSFEDMKKFKTEKEFVRDIALLIFLSLALLLLGAIVEVL